MATLTLKLDATAAIEQLQVADDLINQLVTERQEIRAYADGLEEWILKNERKLEDLQDEVLRLRNGAIQQDKEINEAHTLKAMNESLTRELNEISAALGLAHTATPARHHSQPIPPRESEIRRLRAELANWEEVRRYVEQQLGRGGLNAEHLVDLFAAKDDQIQKLQKQAKIDGAEIARLQTGALVSEVRDLRQCLEFANADVKALEGVNKENDSLRAELARAKLMIEELERISDKQAKVIRTKSAQLGKLTDAVRYGEQWATGLTRDSLADLRAVMERALKC